MDIVQDFAQDEIDIAANTAEIAEGNSAIPDDTAHGRSYINPIYKPDGSSYQLAALRPRHLAIMDFMLAHVTLPYGQIAARFGVTPAWLSTVVNSDLFQAKLNERRSLMETRQRELMGEKLLTIADKSLNALNDALDDEEVGVKTKLEISKTALTALGYLGSGKRETQTQGPITNVAVSVSVADDAIRAARERLLSGAQAGRIAPALLESVGLTVQEE